MYVIFWETKADPQHGPHRYLTHKATPATPNHCLYVKSSAESAISWSLIAIRLSIYQEPFTKPSPFSCWSHNSVTNDEVDESSLSSDQLWHWQQVKQNCGVIATSGNWRQKGINHSQPQRKNSSTFPPLHEKQTIPSHSTHYSAWCAAGRRWGDCLEICKMRKATGNGKPSGDITASSWGQGCKSQIDLNQLWDCR